MDFSCYSAYNWCVSVYFLRDWTKLMVLVLCWSEVRYCEKKDRFSQQTTKSSRILEPLDKSFILLDDGFDHKICKHYHKDHKTTVLSIPWQWYPQKTHPKHVCDFDAYCFDYPLYDHLFRGISCHSQTRDVIQTLHGADNNRWRTWHFHRLHDLVYYRRVCGSKYNPQWKSWCKLSRFRCHKAKWKWRSTPWSYLKHRKWRDM